MKRDLTTLVDDLDSAATALERLRALDELRATCSLAEGKIVKQARAEGASWRAIARALRISPQAVWKRYAGSATR